MVADATRLSRGRGDRRLHRLRATVLLMAAGAGLWYAAELVRGQFAPERAADAAKLEEVLAAFARHEQASLPYYIRARMHLNGDGRAKSGWHWSRFPWGDGRRHERLMEYAQREPGTWLRKETTIIDDVPQSQFDLYVREYETTQVSRRPGREEPPHVVPPQPGFTAEEFVWVEPLEGLFPLSSFSKGVLLTTAIKNGDVAPELEMAGTMAKLSFRYAADVNAERFVLWLSRAHDWHPVRLQRFTGPSESDLYSEWSSNPSMRGGQWRIVHGSMEYFERPQPRDRGPAAAVTVWFDVEHAEYGAVRPDLFDYKAPADAVFRAPRDRLPPPPPELTRDVAIQVQDVLGAPVAGAAVQVHAPGERRLGGSHDLGTHATDADGGVQVRAPDGDLSLTVTADGFRTARFGTDVSQNPIVVKLAPITTGRVIDASGAPVSEALVSNGVAVGLSRISRERPVVTDSAGSFAIATDLFVRKTTVFSAVDRTRTNMAIAFLSTAELAKPLTLVLKPVCKIQGTRVLEGVSGPTEVRLELTDSAGRWLAALEPALNTTEEGLEVAFRLMLPPGEYVLRTRSSAAHSSFSVRLTVPEGQTELDLGSERVPLNGIGALVGKPAPALSGRWRDGEQVALSDLRGDVVVLDFWGVWCGPCISWMPQTMNVAESFRDRPVSWISVHTPDEMTFDELDARLAEFAQQHWDGRTLPFPVVIDEPAADGENELAGVTGRRYGIEAWPTLVVIDRAGNVAGAATKENLAQMIESLLR